MLAKTFLLLELTTNGGCKGAQVGFGYNKTHNRFLILRTPTKEVTVSEALRYVEKGYKKIRTHEHEKPLTDTMHYVMNHYVAETVKILNRHLEDSLGEEDLQNADVASQGEWAILKTIDCGVHSVKKVHIKMHYALLLDPVEK